MDPGFAKTVVRNFESSITVLENIYQDMSSNSNADIELYTITVHGIKGALANIGETDLSNIAYKLEQAGYDKNKKVIKTDTPAFIDTLRMMIVKYKPKEKTKSANVTNDDMTFLTEKLDEVRSACERYDMSEAEAVFGTLKEKAWSHKINDLMDEIAENLLCGKLKEVITAVDNFNNTAK
jgi:HPt (histidine-containing phosphotransfer) domain-containing protein